MREFRFPPIQLENARETKDSALCACVQGTPCGAQQHTRQSCNCQSETEYPENKELSIAAFTVDPTARCGNRLSTSPKLPAPHEMSLDLGSEISYKTTIISRKMIDEITGRLFRNNGCKTWMPSNLVVNTDFLKCVPSEWSGTASEKFNEAFVAALRYIATATLYLNRFIILTPKQQEEEWKKHGKYSLESKYGPYTWQKRSKVFKDLNAMMHGMWHARSAAGTPIRFTCHWEKWSRYPPACQKPYTQQECNAAFAKVKACDGIWGSTEGYGGFRVVHLCYKWPTMSIWDRIGNVLHEMTHAGAHLPDSDPMTSFMIGFINNSVAGTCYPWKHIPGVTCAANLPDKCS